jgi:nucleoside-diphosphate-sugar epimerase
VLLWLAARGVRLRLGRKRRLLNFCHVADVISAILLAATHEQALGQSYLVGDVRNYTLDEAGAVMVDTLRASAGVKLVIPPALVYAAGAAAELLSAAAGTRAILSRDRARLLVQSNWAMCIARAQEQLGYAPRYDLATGIAQTASWCRETGWL